MGRRQQRADRALRPAMRSPGRAKPPRQVERAFWRVIAAGASTEETGLEVGVSTPVAASWFRHAGGMPPLSLAEAIYQALYIEGHGALKRELVACLRTGRALRKSRERSQNKAQGHVTEPFPVAA